MTRGPASPRPAKGRVLEIHDPHCPTEDLHDAGKLGGGPGETGGGGAAGHGVSVPPG